MDLSVYSDSETSEPHIRARGARENEVGECCEVPPQSWVRDRLRTITQWPRYVEIAKVVVRRMGACMSGRRHSDR